MAETTKEIIADGMADCGNWLDHTEMLNPAEAERDLFERIDDYGQWQDSLLLTPTLFPELPGLFEVMR